MTKLWCFRTFLWGKKTFDSVSSISFDVVGDRHRSCYFSFYWHYLNNLAIKFSGKKVLGFMCREEQRDRWPRVEGVGSENPMKAGGRRIEYKTVIKKL